MTYKKQNRPWPALRLIVLCAVGSIVLPASVLAARDAKAVPPLRIEAAKKEAIKLNKLPPVAVPHTRHPRIDHSGRKEIGRASFYSRRFDGRKTAAGQRFNPNKPTAASKTLPIGTTARVIDLSTGRAANVTVNDRGPYVPGRMLDVSPKVAAELKMKHKGLAPVVVEPITVPQPNGGVKLGAGAATVPGRTIQADMQITKHIAAKPRKKPVQ